MKVRSEKSFNKVLFISLLVVPLVLFSIFILKEAYSRYILKPHIDWSHEANFFIGDTQPLNNGMIYVGTTNGVFGLDLKTGQEKWKYSDNFSIKFLISSVFENNVFLVKDNGDLIALDGFSGEKKWKVELKKINFLYGADGKALYLSSGQNVLALNLSSGKQIWRVSRKSAPTGYGIVSNNGIYFIEDKTLYALNSDNGSEKWKYDIIGLNILRSPTIEKGKINFTNTSIDEITGQKVESLNNSTMYETVFNEKIVTPNTTYILDFKNTCAICIDSYAYFIKAIDSNSQNLKWKWDKPVNPQILEKDGNVYFISEGVLYDAK